MPKPKHPGGAPRISDGLQKRRNIALSDDLASIATALGNGNLSAGIRRAIQAADDDHPIDPTVLWSVAELLQGASTCINQARTLLKNAAQPPAAAAG